MTFLRFLLIGFLALLSSTRAFAHPVPNLFKNSSFETGKEPWNTRLDSPSWHDFEISSQRAHRGKHSALLRLVNEDPKLPLARIWGIIQDPKIQKVPGKLSVWYRVENWHSTSAKQYIQVVAMVESDKIIPGTKDNTLQLRYVLGGSKDPPYVAVRNAKYIMAGPAAPLQNKWLFFSTDVAKDFEKAWGFVPQVFKKIEFFFEVRYDEPIPAGETASADVYWDDLSLFL
jgi:hypothetical protein